MIFYVSYKYDNLRDLLNLCEKFANENAGKSRLVNIFPISSSEGICFTAVIELES